MIIIIGSSEEYHSRFIYEKIEKQNTPVAYFDTRKYPIISWSPDNDNNYIILDNKKIYTHDITGIYWRWHYGFNYEISDIVHRERVSAVEDFLMSVEHISYNSYSAIELHKKKGFQSKIMLDNGIRIPKTLITNDPDAVIDFCVKHDNLIYKPVRGGALTKRMTNKDLERLNKLHNCPIQLQECIEGVDIRVYAFDTGEIYSAEIRANDIDFRGDENAPICNVELPDNVKSDCLKVLKILGLKYSGIDIRLSNNGEYVFIEANPAPMFTYFEEQTGYPISDTLIKNLSCGHS